MLTRTRRRILFWVSLAAFLLAVPLIILSSLGYRLDSELRLRKTGGLYISSPLSGSEIFVNGDLKKRTNLLQSGIFIQNLSPRTYHVLVLKEGYLPWSKNLEVSAQKVNEARSLLLPQETNGTVLLRGKFSKIFASPFDEILLLVQTRDSKNVLSWYLPREREFLFAEEPTTSLTFKKSFEIVRFEPNGAVLKLDGNIRHLKFDLAERRMEVVEADSAQEESPREEMGYAERRDPRNTILVHWEKEKRELQARWLLGGESLPYYLKSEEELLIKGKTIRNFEFFPGRRDAILAAFDNGVWAVELDGRDTRQIFPLYKGKEPDFALLPSRKEVYILDDGILIQALLAARE